MALSRAKPALAVTLVTGNAAKLAEVQRMLVGSAVTVVSRSIDLPELQGMPEDVAREKCRAAAKLVEGPVLVEDSSLCFNALNGLPGVFVKWFEQQIGLDGLVKLLDGFEDKSAYAQCIFALTSGPDEEVKLFKGRTQGRIVPARVAPGINPFGWDPIFEPVESGGKTFGEMSKDDKNAISHRGRALQLVVEHLSQDKKLKT